MENKELEKLSAKTALEAHKLKNNYAQLSTLIDQAIRLADKQGYMRALKDVEEMLPKWDAMDGTPENWYGFNQAMAQAHDAITRLIDGIYN